MGYFSLGHPVYFRKGFGETTYPGVEERAAEMIGRNNGANA